MRLLMQKLTLPVPPFVRQDAVAIAHSLLRDGDGEGGTLRVTVSSVHGKNCPMPIVDSVSFELEDEAGAGPAVVAQPPFAIETAVGNLGAGLPVVRITLHLHEESDADKRAVSTRYAIERTSEPAGEVFAFTTQVVEYGGGGGGEVAKAEEPGDGGAGFDGGQESKRQRVE